MVLENILPMEVVRMIYSYDNTYREYYEENVLNMIERSWAIKWIDNDTGGYGLDYSHYDIFSVGVKVERLSSDPELEYIYRLTEAKEICKIQNERARNSNKNIVFKPEHILKGDMDGTHLLNHHHMTYLIRL